MFAFQICVIGIIITGGGLVNSSSYKDLVVYGVMGCLFLSYAYFFCVREKNLTMNSAEKCLTCFVVIGLIHVLLSYLGVYQGFEKLDLYFNSSFIPRQAAYLLVLPAIILFQDKFYTKAKAYLLSHYGEFLFWSLFIISFLLSRKALQVSAQLLLCWMALKIKSPQPWRNWARYAVVLAAPLPRDGSLTILILRFLFLLILLIPSGWNRLTLKWTAIGLMIVLIAVSFVAPLLISDTSFIPDNNAVWRLNYWIDEVQNLRNTYGLGVGYGTSYPSIGFAAKTPDFYATNAYSQIERTFVLACHNSLVSVAMRTGVFGILAFLLFIFMLLRETLRYPVLPSKAAFFALFGAIVCIAFNVGLESPNYMFSFIFCLGECNQEVTAIRRMTLLQRQEQENESHGCLAAGEV